MATLGLFTKNDKGFTGSIETLTLKAQVTFELNEKKSDNAPDYRLLLIADGFVSEIGAAWKKTAKKSGAEYLSVSLDDASFAEPIYCRLVKTGAEKGHSLLWERERPRD